MDKIPIRVIHAIRGFSFLAIIHPMESVVLNVKVVPSSSRDRVAGRYGDGIKIQTSAPPEGGKANRAVTKILAQFLSVKVDQVQLCSAPSSPRKQFRISGISPQHLLDRLSGLK